LENCILKAGRSFRLSWHHHSRTMRRLRRDARPRLQTSRIRQEHRPIRYHLPARLSFRQGQDEGCIALASPKDIAGSWRRVVPRAFGVLVGHLPSAILSLPAFVSRSPPDNSCMYPSWISRSLCSAGIVRCIKPLAQSRNETNSSWVNGADKSGFIFQICASGAAVQASHPATIKLTHYRAFRLDV
jgi:hypothetical protein